MQRDPGSLDAREGRRVFGLDPVAYATGRPGHPAWVYETLEQQCGLAPGAATLEIGPGGGQATAELLARGAAPLVAVEPNPALADFLVGRFAGRLEIVRSTLEAARLPAGAFQLAVSASAFHWVDQAIGLRRVAAALRAGGSWAAWWTMHGDPDRPDELHDALQPILGHLQRSPASTPGGTPFGLDRAARAADLEATGAFEEPRFEVRRGTRRFDPASARALYGTFSPILALPAAERERVLDGVAATIADRFGGSFESASVTALVTARRR